MSLSKSGEERLESAVLENIGGLEHNLTSTIPELIDAVWLVDGFDFGGETQNAIPQDCIFFC
jgi:hypothetical protein